MLRGRKVKMTPEDYYRALESLLLDLHQRIRDVKQGPDGFLYNQSHGYDIATSGSHIAASISGDGHALYGIYGYRGQIDQSWLDWYNGPSKPRFKLPAGAVVASSSTRRRALSSSAKAKRSPVAAATRPVQKSAPAPRSKASSSLRVTGWPKPNFIVICGRRA